MNFYIRCDAFGSTLQSQDYNDGSDSGSWAGITPADPKTGETTMPAESQPPEKEKPLELATDFPRESRYEFVASLAYKLWEKGDAHSGLRTSTGSQRNTQCTRR
jgi:hypothetical protein